MRKKWLKKTTSFSKAAEFDHQYYQKMSPEERLEIVQVLREQASKIKKGKEEYEDPKRLRRVIKVTERK